MSLPPVLIFGVGIIFVLLAYLSMLIPNPGLVLGLLMFLCTLALMCMTSACLRAQGWLRGALMIATILIVLYLYYFFFEASFIVIG